MTTATRATPLQDVLKGVKVIDCDTHFTEPPDLWTSRAPAKFKDRVPVMRTIQSPPRGAQPSGPVALEMFSAPEGSPVSMWFIEGSQPFGPVGTTVIGKNHNKVYGKLSLATFEELDAAAYEPKARLKLMDRLGLHAQIVYPNAAGFSSTRFMSIPDEDLRLQCIKI